MSSSATTDFDSHSQTFNSSGDGAVSPTATVVSEKGPPSGRRSSANASPLGGGVENGAQQHYTVEYLAQLLKDKKQLAAFPSVFGHLDRLVDEEINKVRVSLFQFEFSKEATILPEPIGDVVTATEKVFVPVKDYPDDPIFLLFESVLHVIVTNEIQYNFVGRILGPRGMTAKQLEQETGCKIMVRGRGSMRDKKKEEMNRGKPNWEHLNEELHVLIQCEDTENRCSIKLERAVDEIKKLLVPAPEGEDDLKRKQLMELAIINGTYRPASQQNQQQQLLNAAALQPRFVGPLALQSPSSAAAAALRSPSLAGAPIILSPTNALGGRHAAGGLLNVNPAAAAAAALAAANFLPQHCALSAANLPSFPTVGGSPTSDMTQQYLIGSTMDPALVAAMAAYPYAAALQAFSLSSAGGVGDCLQQPQQQVPQAQWSAGAPFNSYAIQTALAAAPNDGAGGLLRQRKRVREHPYIRKDATS